jgi:DnaK suppressor protein
MEPAKKSASVMKAKVETKGEPKRPAAHSVAKSVPKKPLAPPAKAPKVEPASSPNEKHGSARTLVEKTVASPPAANAAPKPAAPPTTIATKVAPKPTEMELPSSDDVNESALAGADADELEGADTSTNLLAGPRNVQPYIPRRGEQYMSKEQLEHFRQILMTWKLDLMEEVDRTVLHMKDEAANFPDPNDRATQESEFSLELRTRDRERKLIRKIDEAIKRIEDGTYGYCNETGEEIGIKRLEARPVATLCVEAQERRERREKQYGDRDDRYR